MQLTRASLRNRVAVTVAGILIILFGVISLFRLPVQLSPDIERPVISIQTDWRAAAPLEIESEIVEPQENVLRGLPGVRQMSSSSSRGRGTITLEFDIDTDMGRALVEVMNALNQVPRYPVDITEPVINVGGGGFGNTIAWFAIQTQENNPRDIAGYQSFIDEFVLPRLERVSGVASSGSVGGRSDELRITFDPYKAASLGIDITTIGSRLGSNKDVSAGTADVGRRRYTIRFAGQYNIEALGDLVLEWRDNHSIHLRDIATVARVLQDRSGVISGNGGPSIALNITPETGVNVLEVMDGIKAAVRELETNILAPEGLKIIQTYDETVYIKASIRMVRNNLILGMLLAVTVLWWFLRRFRATLIVAMAIPLCLFSAFIVLDLSGRTLNIISLAGMAFATGMVLDAAIVVLENIFRQREQGLKGDEASDRGTAQVWGALVASTATTVAIFMPVVFLKDEAGQLFADLAITISVAVVASLIVAITVLPAAASRWVRAGKFEDIHIHWWRAITNKIMLATDTQPRRWAWVLGLTIIPILFALLLKPSADYLPEGKRNFAFGFIVTPPGLNVDTADAELISVIDKRFEPYLQDQSPLIKYYFLGFLGSGAFIGLEAKDPEDMDEILGLANRQILQGFPDTFGFLSRAPVFRGSRGGRSIDVDLQGDDFESLLVAGQVGFAAIKQALPGANVRPLPGLELAEPEIRLIPDDRRIAEVGWNRELTATAVRALGSGAFLGEYFDGSQRLNIILRADKWDTPEELAVLPLATPFGGIQTVGELAEVTRTAGPTEIRRIDRRRTLTLQVTPPQGMPLEDAIAIIKSEVVPMIEPLMPASGQIAYHGSAEALAEVLKSMAGSFLLAIIILYLLISALFKSFRDSLLVILTIPMATVGGIISIRIMDLVLKSSGGQAMDLLTMIGFVILLGLVVNNAILLVYRARDAEREGMPRRDAVESAVRLRLRPILMSTMTSIFGMLPLMLMPGSGTELYRGMAAVIVGGMLVSAVFTLLLLPSLLRMNEGRKDRTTHNQQQEPA
ncbi:MAG: efflux RND transporter permease subunit [Xanthomonadales bacterium]|nr:efflux RND transporter permease subunit [Xanthomonadales bacterium]